MNGRHDGNDNNKPPKTRKRMRYEANWKISKQKFMRNSGHQYINITGITTTAKVFINVDCRCPQKMH